MENAIQERRFAVRKSRPGLGHGLFAAVPLSEEEFLLEYRGKRIPGSYADTLKNRYLFEISREWTIDGSSHENLARYMNHSCIPNCECELRDGKVLIFAVRDIKQGEELTFDYGEEYFSEFIQPAGCKCSKCSRGVLARHVTKEMIYLRA